MANHGNFDNYCTREDEYLLFENQRKAIKQHHCTECCRIIEVGNTYKVSRLKKCASWTKYRTCKTCDNLLDWLIKNTDGETCAFGELYEEFKINEIIEKNDPELEDHECVWISSFSEVEIEQQYPLLIRLKQEIETVKSVP